MSTLVQVLFIQKLCFSSGTVFNNKEQKQKLHWSVHSNGFYTEHGFSITMSVIWWHLVAYEQLHTVFSNMHPMILVGLK